MSGGWLPDADGYTMLSAVEFGKEIAKATQNFDFAMRSHDGNASGYALREAVRNLRKAIESLKSIEFSAARIHANRTDPKPPRAPQ